ncbi:MAG: RNA pyrophosphohydrolase [Ilumatobacteraceae bacterium]|nr:RNA pyrophosphohydrolase [Ilumatobacteraceae bacterium]
MPSMHFRAGVVAVVTNDAGQVMAFERSDVPNQWQLPQGGIEPGEAPIATAWRELAEETALGATDVDLVAEYPEWTVYEWPPDVRQNGKRLGQAQRWFTFRVRRDDVVPSPDGVEFISWRWVEPQWLIDQVVGFRRPAYERVLTP